MKQTLHWWLVLPNSVSQCCVHLASVTVRKHHDFCFTFYKADVTSRALFTHFVSWFYMLDASKGHSHNGESGSQLKTRMLSGGVFLDALLQYQ